MRNLHIFTFINALIFAAFVYFVSSNTCFANDISTEETIENETAESLDAQMEENYFEHVQIRIMLGGDIGHVGIKETDFNDHSNDKHFTTNTAGFNIGADFSYSWFSGVGMSARLDYSSMWQSETGDFDIQDFNVLSIEGYLKYTFHPFYPMWIYIGLGVGFSFTDGYMPGCKGWSYDDFKIPLELGLEWSLTDRLVMGCRINLAVAGLLNHEYRTDWKPALTIGYII